MAEFQNRVIDGGMYLNHQPNTDQIHVDPQPVSGESVVVRQTETLTYLLGQIQANKFEFAAQLDYVHAYLKKSPEERAQDTTGQQYLTIFQDGVGIFKFPTLSKAYQDAQANKQANQQPTSA